MSHDKENALYKSAKIYPKYLTTTKNFPMFVDENHRSWLCYSQDISKTQNISKTNKPIKHKPKNKPKHSNNVKPKQKPKKLIYKQPAILNKFNQAHKQGYNLGFDDWLKKKRQQKKQQLKNTKNIVKNRQNTKSPS